MDMVKGLLRVDGWQNPRHFMFVAALELLAFQVFSESCMCGTCLERFEDFHDSLHACGIEHGFADTPGVVLVRVSAGTSPFELLKKVLGRDVEEVAHRKDCTFMDELDLLPVRPDAGTVS